MPKPLPQSRLLPGSNHRKNPVKLHQHRLLGIGFFLLGLFSLLIIQFFKIQILEHERWKKFGFAQHTMVVKEPFKRGVFYSNTDIKKDHPKQHISFVVDIPKFHLYIDPKSIPLACREQISKELYCALEMTDPVARQEMRAQFDKPLRSRRIFAWIEGEKKEEIEKWWMGFAKTHKIARNALFFVKDYQRSYPFGKMLGQVLHTIRTEPNQDREESIPTGGLEYIFDSFLKGKPGKRRFYRSPRHAMDEGELIEAPQHGADVYLTINHCLQAIAEEEIEAQVKLSEAKRGWAIIMHPHTGHILALAQYPWFYPEKYREYFNDPIKLEETQVKAAIDPYEPGSTMKLLTVAIGLMANEELRKKGEPPLFDLEEKIGTMPTFFSGRRKPIKDVRNHRFMNMYIAIQKSSNVYVAKMVDQIVRKFGDQWYRDKLQKVFGFGVRTGIELPGESPGRVPLPGKCHPNGSLEWSKATPYSLAMGHNILVNAFQMLRVSAILFNGGHEVTPTLVKKIVRGKESMGEKEEVLLDHSESSSYIQDRMKKQILDPKILPPLIRATRFVTKRGGFGARGDIPGYTEAGKTSTSEKVVDGIYSKKVHISSFVGAAPIEGNTEVVIFVVIDEPAFGGNHYGGKSAGVAFSKIGERTLRYLGVEPDDPLSLSDRKEDRKKEKWALEVEELEKRYREWNS